MPTLDHHGTPLPLSEHGFLVDPAAWNDDVALLLARDQEGLAELTAARSEDSPVAPASWGKGPMACSTAATSCSEVKGFESCPTTPASSARCWL